MSAPGDPPAIPRPPGTLAGGPAPWAGLEDSARRQLSHDLVAARLVASGQEGLPPPLDRWAAEPISALVRAWEGAAAVPAAVLVATFEEDGETRVVLTRRSTRLRSHRGQVSFPGGRIEPGEDVWAAARRESAEEVGLEAGMIEPVGWLHPVLTWSSRSLILPVVGAMPGRPRYRPNPAEVDRVFDVALSELVSDGVFREERWRARGPAGPLGRQPYPVYFFDVAHETVWGATARLLFELLEVALGLGRRGPSVPA